MRGQAAAAATQRELDRLGISLSGGAKNWLGGQVGGLRPMDAWAAQRPRSRRL